MQSIGMQMTGAITAPLVGAGTLAVKTAADYERLQIQLNTLAGSAEEGAAAFQRLQEFSAGTPFQLNDLVRANNIIVGMGRSMDVAFEDLQMLGDVASATGANISELATTFGQAAAEGKLMSRDIREFINRGIPLTKLLAETMGVATDQVFDLASQGEITFDVLVEALEDATTGTGLYANATEKAADSISGVFSTLRDNINRALSEIGNSLVETFDLKELIRGLIQNIQQGIQWFNSLSQEVRQGAFIMAGVLGASGPIIAALGTLSLAIGAISAPIAGVVAAFAGASAAIISNWDEVSAYFTSGAGSQLWTAIKTGVSEIWSSLQDLFSSLSKLTSTFSSSWGADVTGVVTKSVSIIAEAVTKIIDSISLIINLIRGDWSAAWQDFKDVATSSMQDLDEQMFLSMGSMMQSATAMTNLLTGDFSTAFEQFKFAYGFDNRYSRFQEAQRKNEQATRNAMKALDETTGILRVGNKVTESVSNTIDILSNGYGVLAMNANTAAEAVENANQASQQTGGEGEQAVSISTKFLPPEQPISEVIQADLPSLEELTRGIDLNIGEKIFPPGSLGALQERLTVLRERLMFATDPAIIERLRTEMQMTQEEINQITGNVNGTSAAMQQFGRIAGQVLSQAVLHADSLLETLKNIAKQLASRTLMRGLSLLLSGGFSGVSGVGGVFKKIFGGVFHSGGIVPGSGERLILAQGGEGVFTPGQMAALGNMRSQPSSGQSTQKAFENALRNVVTEVSPSRVFELSEKGKRGF